jgi:hypothetical protein
MLRPLIRVHSIDAAGKVMVYCTDGQAVSDAQTREKARSTT